MFVSGNQAKGKDSDAVPIHVMKPHPPSEFFYEDDKCIDVRIATLFAIIANQSRSSQSERFPFLGSRCIGVFQFLRVSL